MDVAEGVIHVDGLDLLNDTPILDIKPYIPAFDSFPEARAGWMDLITRDTEKARLGILQHFVVMNSVQESVFCMKHDLSFILSLSRIYLSPLPIPTGHWDIKA